MSESYERPHVLVVSDDTDLSSFLSEGLVIGGFWVSVIASGIQVIEVFRLRTFDIMLIDVALGGMGTYEVVQRLRAGSGETRAPVDIPILAIAGSVAEVEPNAIAAAGIDEVILPPIEIAELAVALRESVKAWRALHPDRPWADEAAQRRP